MRRLLSVAMALMLVFSFGAGLQARPASAQPAPGGEVISVTDAAGDPWVEISVDGFSPDFTGYDRNYAPGRGFQYAAIAVTITNTGTAPYTPNTYNFAIIDTEGFVSDAAWVVIDEEQAPAMLGSEPIEPGDSVSGTVVFEMLAGTEAAAVTFSVTWDRLHILAMSGTAPAIGETVEVLGPDAQPMANITVDEWLDPLPGVDPSSAPDRGHHFAGAVVTIENIGSGTFQTDPWRFKLLDSDGYEAGGSMPYRAEPDIEDLPYEELASGDSISGLVGFQVFNTATPALIAFEVDDQFAIVAAFPDAPAVPDLSAVPEIAAPDGPVSSDDDATQEADDEGEDTGVPDEVEASEECVAADAWLTEFFAGFDDSPISDFDIEDAPDMTADELTEVRDAMEDLRDALESADAPELTQGVIDAYLDLVEYSIDTLDTLIEAAEDGEDLQPLVDEFLEDDTAADAYFEAFDEFVEACPGLY